MRNKLRVFVINLNNLFHTKNCISDLMKQIDMEFDITVIDNASTEPGTKEYFDFLSKCGINTIVTGTKRVPLNHLWNGFYADYENEYLCFLNNDVRLSNNFTKTTKQVLDSDGDVFIVCHSTNHPEYRTVSDELKYEKFYRKVRQGWDFTIRRKDYTPIPESMEVYYGDDWIYNKVYDAGKLGAIIINSPIYHYLGASVKNLKGDEYFRDGEKYKKLGMKDNYAEWSKYSLGRPTIAVSEFFRDGYSPVLTVNVVTYERYVEFENILKMFQNQTDKRFVLDIWQDGPDARKKAIVDSFNNPKFVYNENPERAGKYGHDMRHKSIMKCNTDLWCTTNDDNLVSQFFVEEILREFDYEYDVLKYSVAMQNLPLTSPGEASDKGKTILMGCTNRKDYGDCMKILDPNIDLCGDVDAASFVTKTDVIKRFGGWHSMKFEGDWCVYEKMLNGGVSIKRVDKVLQVHV